VECVVTEPEVRDSFWFCLIGMGYPTPWRKFRWCTSRLKIRPGHAFMHGLVGEAGDVMVLLGTRSDESNDRARSVRDNEVTDEARLAPDPKQLGARRWQPIKDFTTEEVWETLLQRPPPWGGSYRDLQTLYANSAEADACQLVMFEEDADACGTGGRMGCWTCTVVPKDKSLVAMVAKGREDLEPLVDFRNWLIAMRNDPRNRERFRRNGQHMHDGLGRQKNIGPFTLDARAKILDELLKLQGDVGLPLIRPEEVAAIRYQWGLDQATEAERLARGEAILLARQHRQSREAAEFSLTHPPGATP
jgi:DNA sulfur modification protein DndC